MSNSERRASRRGRPAAEESELYLAARYSVIRSLQSHCPETFEALAQVVNRIAEVEPRSRPAPPWYLVDEWARSFGLDEASLWGGEPTAPRWLYSYVWSQVLARRRQIRRGQSGDGYLQTSIVPERPNLRQRPRIRQMCDDFVRRLVLNEKRVVVAGPRHESTVTKGVDKIVEALGGPRREREEKS